MFDSESMRAQSLQSLYREGGRAFFLCSRESESCLRILCGSSASIAPNHDNLVAVCADDSLFVDRGIVISDER
jgi:hypothetical protein